jgi:hypothetical protein
MLAGPLPSGPVLVVICRISPLDDEKPSLLVEVTLPGLVARPH